MSKNKKKKIFIIDGYATLYRAHYALIRNPLVTTSGIHTSALFGFTNQITRLLKDENPDYIVCAFDSKEKTFRHDIYKAYKANRSPMPEELKQQLPHLWEMLKALNMPVIRYPGYEADDIIGTIAKTVSKLDIETYIVSGDKDFMQLINDKIFLYAPGMRGSKPILYDREEVIKKWDLPPENIIDLLGLMGDSSDNIPGVSGIGEKTAVKLLKKYGSLDKILENSGEVSNKRAQKGLLEGKENALLSKKLATIVTNMNFNFNIDDYKVKSPNNDKILNKYTELEFYALIKEINKKSISSNTQVQIKKDYKVIMTNNELNNLINILNNSDLISIDLETTSLVPMSAEIVGISFCIKEDTGYYIPILYQEKIKENFGNNDLQVVLNSIKKTVENENIHKTGQNIKYDSLILRAHGLKINGIVFDTLIAAHLLNPGLRSYKLENLSLEYLNYEMIPISDLIGTGKSQITMDKVPLKDISVYAAEDADIAYKLTKIFKNNLEEKSLINYFKDIEIPLLNVLIEIEFQGVYVDIKFLKKMSEDIGKRLEKLVVEIYKQSDSKFNINSTQQLANILFDKLNLPQIKKRSTAENILKKLSQSHEIPQLILEYRKFNKLKNTYIDAFPMLVSKKTNRVHTTFNQAVAATGRLSSNNPNFQNIPIRTIEGREIRKAFCAKNEKHKILSADYSQVELRIMAHLSNDIELCKAFNNNEDIHSRTASLVYGIDIESISSEMRRTAKVVNFGIMYGAGAFRLSEELNILRSEAQVLIDAYFQKYSGIDNYIKKTLDKAREDNFVQTILGRKRFTWDINSDNGLIRKSAERMAINMPIQGSAAEMIKIAMININQELIKDKYKSKMVLQIHDELIFEYPEEEEGNLIKMVKDKMENAMQLSVPLVVDYGTGLNWLEAH